jgi:hypothetical protein
MCAVIYYNVRKLGETQDSTRIDPKAGPSSQSQGALSFEVQPPFLGAFTTPRAVQAMKEGLARTPAATVFTITSSRS